MGAVWARPRFPLTASLLPSSSSLTGLYLGGKKNNKLKTYASPECESYQNYDPFVTVDKQGRKAQDVTIQYDYTAHKYTGKTKSV